MRLRAWAVLALLCVSVFAWGQRSTWVSLSDDAAAEKRYVTNIQRDMVFAASDSASPEVRKIVMEAYAHVSPEDRLRVGALGLKDTLNFPALVRTAMEGKYGSREIPIQGKLPLIFTHLSWPECQSLSTKRPPALREIARDLEARLKKLQAPE